MPRVRARLPPAPQSAEIRPTFTSKKGRSSAPPLFCSAGFQPAFAFAPRPRLLSSRGPLLRAKVMDIRSFCASTKARPRDLLRFFRSASFQPASGLWLFLLREDLRHLLQLT